MRFPPVDFFFGIIGQSTFASCCHAHARRKFEAAKSNDPTRASRALAFHRQLYNIEDRAWDFSATG